jgi:hypothetical protein
LALGKVRHASTYCGNSFTDAGVLFSGFAVVFSEDVPEIPTAFNVTGKLFLSL